MVLDGYVRVSTVRGRGGDSFISPRVQEEAIRARIASEGATVGKIETDLDVSGRRAIEERKLELLLKRCEDGESQGIVVFNVDRFSRETAHAHVAAKRLRDCGACLVGASDGVDTRTEAGKLVLGLMATIAESQSDRVGKNWRVAVQDAVERGIHISPYAPAGYRLNGERRLELDPDTADAVREAFQLRANGASYQAVADFLHERGVRPGGSKNERWARSSVRKLLSNRVYLGEARGRTGEKDRNGKPVFFVNKEAHTPLVTPELFAAASKPGRAFQRNGSTAALGWLPGLAYCAGCGHRMRVAGRGKTATYVCLGRFASGDCPSRAAIQVNRLDAFIAETLMASKDPVLDALEDVLERRTKAEEAITAAEADLEGFVMTASAAKPDLFQRGLAAREKALDEARAALYELPEVEGSGEWSSADRILITYRHGQFVPMIWHLLPVAEVRRHLRRFIGRVEVSKAARRGRTAPVAERVQVHWVA